MPDGITPLKQVTLREIHCSKILHKELGELRGIANSRKRNDSFPVQAQKAMKSIQIRKKNQPKQKLLPYTLQELQKNWPCVSYARFAKIALLAPPTPKIITELDCVSAPPFRV